MKKTITFILSVMFVLSVTVSCSSNLPTAVKGFTLNNSNISLEIGQTSDLKATFDKTSSQTSLTYLTDDEKIATVSADGKITGVGKGTATITVTSTSDQKISAKCSVTVTGLAPVQLTYYLVFNSAQPDQDAVFEAFNKITKEKINTTIKFVAYDYASYEEKMKVVLAAGDNCDLLWTSSWNTNYFQNVAKGAYAPISDLLAKYGKGLLQDIPKNVWDAVTVKGKIYGIPSYQVCVTAKGMVIRKDLADKYKFDTTKVKHVADLEPLLKACKAGGDAVYVPAIQLWDTGVKAELGYEEISSSAPGAIKMSDSSAKVFNQYTTTEFKEYIKMARSWYLAGYIRKDVLSIKNDPIADYKAGKYVVGMGGNLNFDGAMAAEGQSAYGGDWYEARLSEPVFTTGSITSTITAITQSCKTPDRAVMFEELLNSSSELLNLLGFGIEGKNYTKVSDGVIDIPKDSKYNTGWNWSIGNSFKMFVVAPNTADTNKKVLATHAKATGSPLLGFVFDPTPVLDEIAQCKSVYEELRNALVEGAVDPDVVYPQFIEKLEKAGSLKVIAEEQKQIDAWKATK